MNGMTSGKQALLSGPVNPWWIVAGGALGVSLGAGTIMIYAYGLLATAMAADLDWPRERMASGFTAFLIGSGVGIAALGWLISRYGIRGPSAVLALLFAASFAAIGLATSGTEYLPLLLFVVGVGGSACTALPYAVAIAGFFDRRRGLALGIVVAGAGAGSMYLPQMARSLIETEGWRAGFITIGLTAGLVSTAVIVCLVRTPDGAVPDSGRQREPLARETFRYLRERPFLLILAPILAVSIATFGAMASLVPLLSDKGLAPGRIAAMLSIVGGVSWVSRLLVGAMLDRFPAPFVTSAILMLAAAGLTLLLASDAPCALLVGAALVGLAMGCEADLLTYLVSRYFPLDAFSRVTSLLWVVWAWSGGIGTSLAAYCHAATGSYALSFLGFAVLLVLGAATVAALGPYLYPGDAAQPTRADAAQPTRAKAPLAPPDAA